MYDKFAAVKVGGFMETITAKRVILTSLQQARTKEQDAILKLKRQIVDRERTIDVLNVEIKRMEFIIEQDGDNTNPIPEQYKRSLTWADKIAYALVRFPDGLTTGQIAKELRALDDDLLIWDNPDLAARISAIVGVNRGERFVRDGKLIKLKKAE